MKHNPPRRVAKLGRNGKVAGRPAADGNLPPAAPGVVPRHSYCYYDPSAPGRPSVTWYALPTGRLVTYTFYHTDTDRVPASYKLAWPERPMPVPKGRRKRNPKARATVLKHPRRGSRAKTRGGGIKG